MSCDEDTRRIRRFYNPVEHKLVPVDGFEGLYVCEVCNAGEGELLAYCPGYKLNADTHDACFQGNVVDITFWRLAHNAPCDYPAAYPDE